MIWKDNLKLSEIASYSKLARASKAPLTLGEESAHAYFNLRELPCFLSKTYESLLFLQKFIGEQESVKKSFCQGYNLLPWQPDFQRHV